MKSVCNLITVERLGQTTAAEDKTFTRTSEAHPATKLQSRYHWTRQTEWLWTVLTRGRLQWTGFGFV